MQKPCRQEALHQIVVITQTVKRRRQHKKWKINNSTAGEILTEKHNESHAMHQKKTNLAANTNQPVQKSK